MGLFKEIPQFGPPPGILTATPSFFLDQETLVIVLLVDNPNVVHLLLGPSPATGGQLGACEPPEIQLFLKGRFTDTCRAMELLCAVVVQHLPKQPATSIKEELLGARVMVMFCVGLGLCEARQFGPWESLQGAKVRFIAYASNVQNDLSGGDLHLSDGGPTGFLQQPGKIQKGA